MSISALRSVALSVGLCLLLGAGGSTAVEKIPPDKVVHPLLGPVSDPQVIPEARKDPVYPEQWRKLHLGAHVILQAVIEKSGTVSDITPLMTGLRVEADCGKEPTEPAGKEAAGSKAPPEAGKDFEAAAIKAVKEWKYRPGRMQGVPVDVYYTIVVDFTPCPAKTNPGGPAKH
jgi:hypothetical protein